TQVVSIGGLNHESSNGSNQGSARHLLRAQESAEGPRRASGAYAGEREAAPSVAQEITRQQKRARSKHTRQAGADGLRPHRRERTAACEGAAAAQLIV